MKCDFYTLKHNNVIIATSYSRVELESLLVKLKQNPKQLQDLIQLNKQDNCNSFRIVGNQQ